MTRKWDGENGLSDYLKNGGMLLSPDEVVEPYRTELIKLFSAFFDSELAVSAGFVCLLNMAPNIKQRVNVSRLVAEKADHAKALLDLLGQFGTQRPEYLDRLHSAAGFDWAARLDRHSDIAMGAHISLDKRVPVLYYPIENWLDGVMMYVIMEKAAHILIRELAQIFYKPLATACQLVMTSEREHAHLSREELLRLAKGASKNGIINQIETSFDYWLQRTRTNFNIVYLPYFERLRLLGLPHRSNQEMLEDFNIKAEELRQSLHLVTHL